MAEKLGKEYIENYLRLHLDAHYLTNRRSKIKKSELNYPNHYDITWDEMNQIFEKWQGEGWIKIIKNPLNASDNDFCLKLIKYSTGIEIPKGWIID